MHPDIKLEPEPEWKKCPQCGRENSIATWRKFDGKCPNCGDLYDRDAGTAPSSVTPPQDELEHMKSQRDYLQRVCSKIQAIVDQSDLPDRSSELDVLPSSVAILAARASSSSSAGTATDPLKPSATLLIKLGSMVVHLEEILSPKRHEYDIAALNSLKEDEEVIEWFRAMNKMAFLPVRR